MKTPLNRKLLFGQSARIAAWLGVVSIVLCFSNAPRAHGQSGGPGKSSGVVKEIDDARLEIRNTNGRTETFTETHETRWLNKNGQPIDAGDVVGKNVEVRWRWITGGSEALSVQLSSGGQSVSSNTKAVNPTSKSGSGAPSNKSSMDAKDTAVEAHQFVQKFYIWYASFSAHSKSLACKEVLDAHPEYFSKALKPMLQKNITEMKKTGGLGLGFDPFFNSQDPASKFVVGPADGTDEGYAMEVYSVRDGQKQSEPDLIAVVENQHNSWVFTNFHYPNLGKSLRQLLQAE